MTTTKRIISVLLSLLLLIGLLPMTMFSAAAEITAVPLTFGEEVTVTLGVNEAKWYSFTPTETAAYSFVSTNNVDVDPVANLYNSAMELIASGDDYDDSNFSITEELTAGETYYLEAHEFDRNNEGSYTLVVQVALPTDVFFDEYSLTSFVGVTFTMGVNLWPENANNTLKWTSSNETVATVEDGEVTLLAAGETEIKVETLNGLTDTCYVTVKPVHGTVSLNTEIEVAYTEAKETRMETQRYYAFTPTETGYYRLYTYDIMSDSDDPVIDPRAWVYDKNYDELAFNDDGGEDVNASVEVALEAGETYYFMVELYDSMATGSFNAMLEQMTTAESVSIDSCDLTLEQGDIFDIYVTYSPAGAWQEDYVVTSSDESVVKVVEKTIYAVGGGEATVTVTTDFGLTDSIVVTVFSAEELELDTTYTLEGDEENYGGNKRYVFTPTEAGLYTIASTGATGENVQVSVQVSDDETQLRCHNTQSDSFSLTYELEAGKPYFYDVYVYCEGEAGSVDFMLTKADTATIPEAQLNTDLAVDISNPGDGAYYVFKPAATGMYAIYSMPGEGGTDTKLYVYNSEWELFYSDDDGAGDGQFLLEEEFTKGETYYLKPFLYSDEDTGSYNMRVEPQFNVLGDLDGNYAVDMMDAFILYSVVSAGNVTDGMRSQVDMNSDGTIDMLDAFALYRVASGAEA